jgi:hypothetical protein
MYPSAGIPASRHSGSEVVECDSSQPIQQTFIKHRVHIEFTVFLLKENFKIIQTASSKLRIAKAAHVVTVCAQLLNLLMRLYHEYPRTMSQDQDIIDFWERDYLDTNAAWRMQYQKSFEEVFRDD